MKAHTNTQPHRVWRVHTGEKEWWNLKECTNQTTLKRRRKIQHSTNGTTNKREDRLRTNRQAHEEWMSPILIQCASEILFLSYFHGFYFFFSFSVCSLCSCPVVLARCYISVVLTLWALRLRISFISFHFPFIYYSIFFPSHLAIWVLYLFFFTFTFAVWNCVCMEFCASTSFQLNSSSASVFFQRKKSISFAK